MPFSVRKLFWEHNTDSLDLDQHRAFIIERILEKGNKSSLSWLFDTYKTADVQSVVENSSNLKSETFLFWHGILSNAYSS